MGAISTAARKEILKRVFKEGVDKASKEELLKKIFFKG